MLYRLIALLPQSLQAFALRYLPSQKLVAGAVLGLLTALLTAIGVVEVSPELASVLTVTAAAVASWLVPQDPDTPRAKVQRELARADEKPDEELALRVGIARVQNLKRRR